MTTEGTSPTVNISMPESTNFPQNPTMPDRPLNLEESQQKEGISTEKQIIGDSCISATGHQYLTINPLVCIHCKYNKNAGGRPCAYCEHKEKYQEISRTYLSKFDIMGEKKEPPFIQELAALLHCDTDTIENWEHKKDINGDLEHPEFFGIVKQLRNIQQLRLQQRTLGRYNPTGAIFLLKAKHGFIETEKRVLAGSTNEPLNITITEEKPIPEND